MSVHNEIQYASIDDLFLDPENPRLGRSTTRPNLEQEKILELMQDWTLDELAVSFLESGFWVQEALIVVDQELKEKLYDDGKKRLVVIEGNRRLAALTYLKMAIEGIPPSSKWARIAQAREPQAVLFTRIPYIKADRRDDIRAFLGFRHVTGIKEWRPAEKAEYIAELIENSHMTYEEVMRAIGSNTPTVRQNYISYRLLLQMERQESIAIEKVEQKFSVLYLSLRTVGTRRYLQIDIEANPEQAKRPVSDERLKELTNFALWLFGNDKQPPLFTDSRRVDDFGAILESPVAVEYLERSKTPSFDRAFSLAGGDEPELVRLVDEAADNIGLALMRAHRHTDSERLRHSVERLGEDARQLLSLFPDLRDVLCREAK